MFEKFLKKPTRIKFSVDGKPPKKTKPSLWSENSNQTQLVLDLRQKAYDASKKAGLDEHFHGPVKLTLTVYDPNPLERKDIFKILHSVKDIIKSEAKNDIYINVSSGSKIQAIACMMACMMFNENENLIPYYAVPEIYPTGREKQQSRGLKEIKELPKYQIQIPKQELIQALEIIKENNNKITKKEMAKKAESEKLITIHARQDNFEQAKFASLDKNIIQPLIEQWKFVKVDKIGRTRWVKLTPDGINAIEFLV